MSAITGFAGSIPENYERYLGPLFFEPYATDLAERVGPGPYSCLLELACGTGRLTKHLLPKIAAHGTLQATDLNEDMLRIATQQVQDARLSWTVADAHQLPFGDNYFDIVVCQFGVMFFADRPMALQEVYRVLRPGGVFHFNTWDRVQENALSHTTETIMLEAFPDGPPSFFSKGPYSLFDPALIRQLLGQAGFQHLSLEKVAKTSVLPTADAAVSGMLDGTPLRLYLNEHPETESQVRQRLRQALVQSFGETDLFLPMQAFVCKGVKPL